MFAKTLREFEDIRDSFSFTAILDDRGRIVIPASIRKRLRIKFGSLIVAKIDSPKSQHELEGVEKHEE